MKPQRQPTTPARCAAGARETVRRSVPAGPSQPRPKAPRIRRRPPRSTSSATAQVDRQPFADHQGRVARTSNAQPKGAPPRGDRFSRRSALRGDRPRRWARPGPKQRVRQTLQDRDGPRRHQAANRHDDRGRTPGHGAAASPARRSTTIRGPRRRPARASSPAGPGARRRDRERDAGGPTPSPLDRLRLAVTTVGPVGGHARAGPSAQAHAGEQERGDGVGEQPVPTGHAPARRTAAHDGVPRSSRRGRRRNVDAARSR